MSVCYEASTGALTYHRDQILNLHAYPFRLELRMPVCVARIYHGMCHGQLPLFDTWVDLYMDHSPDPFLGRLRMQQRFSTSALLLHSIRIDAWLTPFRTGRQINPRDIVNRYDEEASGAYVLVLVLKFVSFEKKRRKGLTYFPDEFYFCSK